MRPKEPLTQPSPISGPTNDHVDRIIHHAGGYYGEVQGEAPTVTVNDVVQGPQSARAVALLGIDIKTLDRAWYDFLTDTLSWPVTGAPPPEWLKYRQEGSGWRVDVTIPESVDTVEDLAYIDTRSGERWVTYTCRRWNDVTGVRNPGDPVPPGATFEMRTRKRRLEDMGAIAMSWFAVDEDEHKSTQQASAAMTRVVQHLRDALDEIEVADRVAKAAWKGPRAEAARFRFATEYDVIDGIHAVSANWDQFLSGLVTAQAQARKDDQQLLTDIRNELGKEVAITLTAAGIGMAAAGPPGAAVSAGATAAGRAVYRVAALTAKVTKVTTVASKARAVARRVRDSRFIQHDRFARARKVAGQVWAFRIAAKAAALKAAGEGAKHLGGTAIVNGATGDGKKTLDEWWKSFVFAGVISGGGGKIFDDVARRHGIDMDVAKYGATKEGALGGATVGGKAALTNDPLVGEAVTAPIAGAAKQSAITAIAKELKRAGMSDAKAEKLADEVFANPAIGGLKAGTGKGIDEYRKGPGSADLPTPGEGLTSEPPVAR